MLTTVRMCNNSLRPGSIVVEVFYSWITKNSNSRGSLSTRKTNRTGARSNSISPVIRVNLLIRNKSRTSRINHAKSTSNNPRDSCPRKEGEAG